MAKKKAASYMTSGERAGGLVMLLLYMVVLPLFYDRIFALCEGVLGAAVSPALRSGVCYCVLFAACVIVFRKFLGRTTDALGGDPGGACVAVLTGLVGLYGLNELVYRLGRVLSAAAANLNDTPISAAVEDAPRFSFLIIVFIAPFVEEMLFRGVIFGNLRGKSRAVAYVLSCGLFSLSHVLQFAADGLSFGSLLVLVQYLMPGLMLCRSYERSGTIWAPVGLHALFNALALWT